MLNHSHLIRTDINLLLLFDLLFEERNAGRVAARLHLSPSAVSHALRRLRTTLKDPLFLTGPKGMIPTERAHSLASAIREIIERVGGVITSAEEFDPAKAVRRFRIGAPDGAVSVLVPALVRRIETEAPGIDLAVMQVLPRSGAPQPDHAWRDALADLDAARIDLAILPHSPAQARYHAVPLYSEDFVFVTRRGHPITAAFSTEQLASERHVLVSATGDTSGFVDALLAARGLKRRIALTVPSFFMAADAIASSDLVGALPRRFATEAARIYPLQLLEPPFPMLSTDLHALVPKSAMLDRGIAWLVEKVRESLP
jgi:DNA-binding transcriptional LysR family regulator